MRVPAFANSMMRPRPKKIEMKKGHSEVKALKSEIPMTLCLDPPSMAGSQRNINQFQYNQPSVLRENKQAEIKPKEMEPFKNIPNALDQSHKSFFISYDSEYNSENCSENFDSRIEFDMNRRSSDRRSQLKSKTLSEKIGRHRRFQSDIRFLKVHRKEEIKKKNPKVKFEI